jgi:hypothetical protein
MTSDIALPAADDTANETALAAGAAPRRSLSGRLDREWDRLTHRPEVLACVRSWRLTDRPFASLDALLALAGHRTAPTREADELLARLVAVAADEPLAVRIVLQRILPGLLAIVRDEQQRDPSVDAFDLIVGEAWIAITRYRVETRPTDVAARLLRDARHRAFTCHRRKRVVQEITTPRESMLDIVDESRAPAFDELVDVISEARRRGLDDESVVTIREFLDHGSSAKVAGARSRTDRAIRYRHRRAVTRVRRLVLAA